MKNRTIPFLLLTALSVLALQMPARAQPDPQSVFNTVQEHLKQGKPRRAVQQAEKKITQMKDAQTAFRTRVRVCRLVLDNYILNGTGKAALQEELDTLVEKSTGQARELAYIMAGRMRLFIDDYDRARKLLNAYLQEFSRPSREELQDYAREGEELSEAARRHPRVRRRMIAREILDRLSLLGSTAPSFQLATLDGETVSTRELAGNPTVLVFWRASSDTAAQWMDVLRKVYEDYHEKDVQFLCLGVDRDNQTVRNFVKENNVPGKVIFLGSKRESLCSSFNVRALYPASILVDSEGVIRGVDLKGTALENKLNELLSSSASGTQEKPAQL